MQALALSPEEARPLTSREIAKLFCGVIGSLSTSTDPPSRAVISAVLHATASSVHDAAPLDLRRLDNIAEGWAPHVCITWAAALGATALSLCGWCDPRAVRTAITWVIANIDAICAGDEHADVSRTN